MNAGLTAIYVAFGLYAISTFTLWAQFIMGCESSSE